MEIRLANNLFSNINTSNVDPLSQEQAIQTPVNMQELIDLLDKYNIDTKKWGLNTSKGIEDLYRECELGIVKFSLVDSPNYFSPLIKNIVSNLCSQKVYEKINNFICLLFRISNKTLIRNVMVVKIYVNKFLKGRKYCLVEKCQYFIDTPEQLIHANELYKAYKNRSLKFDDPIFDSFRFRVRQKQPNLNKKVRAGFAIPAIANEALITDLGIPDNIIERITFHPGSSSNSLSPNGLSFPGLASSYTFFPYTVSLLNYTTPPILMEFSETMITVYEWVEVS